LPTEIETCEAGEQETSIKQETSTPSEECMWVEAPESITHGEEPCSCICCSAAIRPAWSHVCAGCQCCCWAAWSIAGGEHCVGLLRSRSQQALTAPTHVPTRSASIGAAATCGGPALAAGGVPREQADPRAGGSRLARLLLLGDRRRHHCRPSSCADATVAAAAVVAAAMAAQRRKRSGRKIHSSWWRRPVL